MKAQSMSLTLPAGLRSLNWSTDDDDDTRSTTPPRRKKSIVVSPTLSIPKVVGTRVPNASEEILRVRHGIALRDWDVVSEATLLFLQAASIGGIEPRTYLLARLLCQSLTSDSAPGCGGALYGDCPLVAKLQVLDFMGMCASLFPRWPCSKNQSEPGSPQWRKDTPVSSVYRVWLSIQTVLLTCCSAKFEMTHADQRLCKKLAATTVYVTAHHPFCVEALAPLFFEFGVPASNEVEAFKCELERLSATGIYEWALETFAIALTRRGNWLLLVQLFANTNLGQRLVQPVTPVAFVCDGENPSGLTQIKRCRSEFLTNLRLPSITLAHLIDRLCHHALPILCEATCLQLIQSLLSLLICRAFHDELLLESDWHRGALELPDSVVKDADWVHSHLHEIRWRYEHDKPGAAAKLHMDDILIYLLTSFVFLDDPILHDDFILLEFSMNNLKLSDAKAERVLRLWTRVYESVQATEKYYSILELCSRIVETFFIHDKRSPASELLDLGNDTTRESILDTSRRTVSELTGCVLSHIEIYLLRLLEAFDSCYGIASELPGLVGPKKTFIQALNLPPLLVQCFIQPVVHGKLQPSAFCCPNIQMTSSNDSNAWTEDSAPTRFVFPTLLPIHVSSHLPAWFATKGNLVSIFAENPRQYLGWRSLCMELFVCSARSLSRNSLEVAPHLTNDTLLSFIALYTDAANPRALHLLSRWTAHDNRQLMEKSVIVNLLERAERSKFVLFADAIAQMLIFDEASMEIANLLLRVYFAADHIHDASIFLRSLGDASHCGIAMTRMWQPKIDFLMALSPCRSIPEPSAAANISPPSLPTATATSQFSRVMRWRQANQILKEISGNDDSAAAAAGAIALFHQLRRSPGNVPDIAVANRIIHICVAADLMNEAEQLYRMLREDAHDGSPNQIKPDVVTGNIILKGLARMKVPDLAKMESILSQMEKPFLAGGDGVQPDQVSYNTMINGAVISGCFAKAWEYIQTMEYKGIRIDAYTCSILMKQIHPSTKPEVVNQILSILTQIEPFEDPVLLASMVDVFCRIKDTYQLRGTLEKYEERVPYPTAYALATLVKGYGRCAVPDRAAFLWETLESASDFSWTPYAFGCGLDFFLGSGNIDKALSILDKALEAQVPMSETHLSALIRACTQKRRLRDALQVYGQMRSLCLYPCDVTYNNLVHLCVVAGDLETAVGILNASLLLVDSHTYLIQEMTQDHKHQPDVVTYSTIIKGLCDRGIMKLAMELFEEMPARGIQPDIVTYNTLIEGFARAEDSVQVENLISRLLDNSVRPTCYTLTILVKYYGRHHRLDKALSLIETFPTLYNIRMDAFVYTAAIAACTWNGRVDRAVKFLHQMRQGFEASTRTYGTLIAGCIKHQSWENLCAVLECASDDKVALSRKDMNSLNDLLSEWKLNNFSHRWIRTGLNHIGFLERFLGLQA